MRKERRKATKPVKATLIDTLSSKQLLLEIASVLQKKNSRLRVQNKQLIAKIFDMAEQSEAIEAKLLIANTSILMDRKNENSVKMNGAVGAD